jgi:hypothetical protein
VSLPPIIIFISPPHIAIDRYNSTTTLATGTEDAIGPSQLTEFDPHVHEGSTTMQSYAQIKATTLHWKKVFEVGRRKLVVFTSHVCQQPRFLHTLFGQLQGISIFVNQYECDVGKIVARAKQRYPLWYPKLTNVTVVVGTGAAVVVVDEVELLVDAPVVARFVDNEVPN